MWKYVTQNSHNDQLNWIKFVVDSLFMPMSPQLACHHKGFQLICWSVNCFMVRWQFGYEYYILAKQTFVWKVKSCSKSNTPHLHVLLYVVLVILVFSFNVTNVLHCQSQLCIGYRVVLSGQNTVVAVQFENYIFIQKCRVLYWW